MKFEQSIWPGIGLGPIRLGMSREEVRTILGDPTEELEEDLGGGDMQSQWEYETERLALYFMSDDGYRLGSLFAEYEHATLGDEKIVGISETDLLRGRFGELGPPRLEEDFGESGRDYEWPDDIGLSCWVCDEHVERICVYITFDETGQIPQWPHPPKTA